MNRTISILCVAIICTSAVAKPFESQQEATKKHVIKMLQQALPGHSVAILHARWDEEFRLAAKLETVPGRILPVWDTLLGVIPQRWVCTLAGQALPEEYDLVYVYQPLDLREAQRRMFRYIDEYTPLMGDMEEMYLVLMRPSKHPDKSRVDPFPPPPIEPRCDLERVWLQFCRDAENMPGDDFLEKHDLGDIFRDHVFHVATGCVFQVDYPAPELPEPPVEGQERERYELARERAPLSKMSSLIHLSPREVSEIVFTAYWLEGADEGAAKYAAACAANPAILLPLTDPADFETEIGKRLFEAVKKAE